MLASISNWTPQESPAAVVKHTRTNSSPYFQNTRTFCDFDSSFRAHTIPAPVTCHVSAASKTAPVKSSRHNRARTESSVPKLPVITTDIKIESAPAVLPISVFNKSSTINFDLSPPDSPILSPEKEKDKWSFIPAFKIDRGPAQRSPSPLRISTWFQGESAPVTLGMASSPTKESSDPISSPIRSPNELLKSNKANSFFSSLFTSKAITPAVPASQDVSSDEFYNLDIKRAIQPQGPADPFSPSSFKNLQQNAEGVLARMQIAYRQKVLSIAEARAEQEAQEEELEEAQTRAQHLKLQLDTLSSRLDERDQEMNRLMKELEEEKRLRQEEVARNRTIRFVHGEKPFERRTRSRTSLGSNASTLSMLSDGRSTPSDLSDTTRHDFGAISSPHTPRSVAWPQDLQYDLLGQPYKSLDHTDSHLGQEASTLTQENTELRTRVGHLEKELDNCLEILKGIGL